MNEIAIVSYDKNTSIDETFDSFSIEDTESVIESKFVDFFIYVSW